MYVSVLRAPSQASVVSSTLDAFFAVADQPHVKARLPVVTQEIGDGWLYGVRCRAAEQDLVGASG